VALITEFISGHM